MKFTDFLKQQVNTAKAIPTDFMSGYMGTPTAPNHSSAYDIGYGLANAPGVGEVPHEAMIATPMIMGATKLFTGPDRQAESDMIPHVIDIYDKAGKLVKTTQAYNSLREAVNVARNFLPIPEGGRAFPRRIR